MENVLAGICRKMENVLAGNCRKMENVTVFQLPVMLKCEGTGEREA